MNIFVGTRYYGYLSSKLPEMVADYNHLTDKELVLLLASGSQQALEGLYNRYWDKLFVVAANLLGNAEEAEECVQNVFVGLWKRRISLQLTNTLQTYLTVAVKYQALTALARSQRRGESFRRVEYLEPLDHVSPEEALIAKELKDRIEQSINRLPPQCQLVFRMSREQDKSVKEIAYTIGLSENTVKMHLKSANKKLRNDLLIYFFFLIHTPFL